MTRRSLVFAAPRRVEVATDDIPQPGDGEVLVRTRVSAISAGTELRAYRGQFPEGVRLDENLSSLEDSFCYPARYGYASVGDVVEDSRQVFAFQPHMSHYVSRDEELYGLPDDVVPEAAALWPTVETAVNLVLDARPLIGERVLVVGQGVVGLMTCTVLEELPLETLVSVDPLEERRQASEQWGASRSYHPDESSELKDFDLTIELSGTASGLNLAIAATGFEGRVVVGSWYGEQPAPIDLGTHFHRGRLSIISSQVSHLGPPLRSRWSKSRRMQTAARVLTNIPAEALVSHRFPIEQAHEAYQLLDEHPERCLQVLLTYT